MNEYQSKLAEIKKHIDKHTEADVRYCSHVLPELYMFNWTTTQSETSPVLYHPGVVISVQGKKKMTLGDKSYNYNPGKFLTLFMPMTIECKIVEASPAEPLMGVYLTFDQGRIAQLLMKLNRSGYSPLQIGIEKCSGIYSEAVNDQLLNAFIRLLETLDDPVKATVLGESIIDEIYFHILYSGQGAILNNLLHRNGQIQQMSKAVDYIYNHMDQTISVDELACSVQMGSSSFHRKFKEVMHLSPVQYIKKIKLVTAQALILEGKSVSEAGYQVGYKSPSQFSREYKRFFGKVPSDV